MARDVFRVSTRIRTNRDHALCDIVGVWASFNEGRLAHLLKLLLTAGGESLCTLLTLHLYFYLNLWRLVKALLRFLVVHGTFLIIESLHGLCVVHLEAAAQLLLVIIARLLEFDSLKLS